MTHKGKHLTQDEFDKLKMFLGTTARKTEIAKITGRSLSTLTKIKSSKTLEDYIALNNKYLTKYDNKKETTPKAKVVSTAISKTNDILPLLERIANALEKMEEYWKPTGEKKNFSLFK